MDVLARAVLTAAADQLEEAKLAPLRAAFFCLDGWLHDGLISARKLRKRLPSLGCQDVPTDLERLLLEVDCDGVGVLDYTTFLAVCLDPKEVASTKLGHDAFLSVDRDEDGKLSLADIRSLLQKAVTEEEAARLFEEANSGSALDFGSFARLLLKSCADVEELPVPHALSDLALQRSLLATSTMRGEVFPDRSWAIEAKTAAMVAKGRKQEKKKRTKKDKKHKSKVNGLPESFRKPARAPTMCATVADDDVANMDDFLGFSVIMSSGSDSDSELSDNQAEFSDNQDGESDLESLEPVATGVSVIVSL
eukprot:TRINITY_DN25421_c0_g2_i1.p1 TRINITY_DN25421_c0_g2~~TRINITY_DN25421_c0_g2_i1.p1  ORF type:complete len:352 (+),score=77.01 TRINITY_DN25421_c0_g2_i1:137-1057(+)